LSWLEFQDLQAVQDGEEKLSAGEEDQQQGPGWELVEVEGSSPLPGPIWSPHPPPVGGEGVCIVGEEGCTPADSLS